MAYKARSVFIVPSFFLLARWRWPDHSLSSPGHQLTHSWCPGTRDLVQRPRGVCTALSFVPWYARTCSDRALNCRLQGHSSSSFAHKPFPGPSSSLRRAPLTALSELTPVRLLTSNKGPCSRSLSSQLLAKSPCCCIAHRGNSKPFA